MKAARVPGKVASAVIGALVGALVVLGADGLTRTLPAGGQAPPALPQGRPLRRTGGGIASRVLLAWSPGGMPPGTEATLEHIPGVRDATTVLGGLEWLRSSHTPDGSRLDAPRPGFAIPLEVAIVQPQEYARFVPPSERDVVLGLGSGEALLARTESEIRGSGAGLQLGLGDRNLRVSGVVSDVATNGYEALFTGRPPAFWTHADRFVLIHLRDARARAAVTKRLEGLLAPGRMLRVRSQKETPFLRYGDAVQPQMIVKKSFGEFAARPLPDGRIVEDPRWVSQSIRTARVPLLGPVTCHRAIFPQLRAALGELRAEGLGYLVDRSQFAGCYNPRFIDRVSGGRLSHHAWGIAVDLNLRDNPFGMRPHQDRRLVQKLEEWGFTWGGRWLVPDGMHFEWNRWP